MTGGISSIVIIWGTLIGGIWLLFYAMEETATPDAKRSAADWIKSIAAKSTSQTIVESPRWFIEAFDRIFGDRHLTWRCFLRSCVASIMAVFVMAIVWIVLDPNAWQQYSKSFQSHEIFFGILILASLFNLVPDYISLLETRWILHRSAHVGIKKLTVLLVLDVIITGTIFACVATLFLFLWGFGIEDIIELLSAGIRFRSLGDGVSGGIFFYSTYFTSVWLYLFIAASIATKLLYSLGRTGNQVLALLKIEEKPFNSMGLLLIGLLTLAFAIYAIIGAIV